MAEYKPAFGSIFEKHIHSKKQRYTHWGYTDIDVLWGDVSRFIEPAELAEYDLFSWGFGDQASLYLRGQWTVHAALPELTRMWTSCPHLGSGLMKEVDAKLAWEKKRAAAVANASSNKAPPPRRFISAEGCYSKAVAATKGIRALLSIKQLIGDDQRHPHVVALDGRVWSCRGNFGALTRAQLLASVGALSVEPARCEDVLGPTYRPKGSGELRALSVKNKGCGGW